jgi:hypothetical protein
MRGVKLVIGGMLILCSSGAWAAIVTPVHQVTNDLWDVAQGTTVTANSGSGAPPIAGMIGFATGAQLAQDSYFADGKPQGFSHFIEIKTVSPVTVRSLNVWGGDDRSSGNTLRRSFNEFRLFGWNGTAFQLLLDLPITLPYAQQGPVGSDGALIVQSDFGAGFTSDRWRAEFVQPAAFGGTFFGPRVLEMDGFNTFLDGTTAVPLPAGLMMGALGAGMAPLCRRSFRQRR